MLSNDDPQVALRVPSSLSRSYREGFLPFPPSFFHFDRQTRRSSVTQQFTEAEKAGSDWVLRPDSCVRTHPVLFFKARMKKSQVDAPRGYLMRRSQALALKNLMEQKGSRFVS